MTGHNVSHSKRRTKRIFVPNLHYATMVVNSVKSRIRLCASCIKTFKRKGLIPIYTKSAKTPAIATA